MKLSLIVPCYNEAGNVKRFYEEVKNAFCNKIEAYEVIFVNDGSGDSTLKEIKKLYQQDRHIKIISFSRNFGKEAAMYAGLQNASGEYTGIIDADLQQSPEIVVEMVKYLDENPETDSVAAVQKHREEGKVRIFFKNIFYTLINKVAEVDLKAGASDFRVFRKNVAEAIINMPEYYRFSKGIFSWIGFETHYIGYIAKPRTEGESKWSIKSLMRYALEGMIAFSTAPLKLAVGLGLFLAIASVTYMFVVIIQKIFFSIDINGYPTIVCLILLLGGIQLLVIGIMGEYLARTYVQGKNRPIYIAKEILKHEEDENNEKDKEHFESA